ncbi:MAG: TIGR03435 family protein [Planctomycetes bacterium]|nr:TIGR03435 family protein [Planctomycetota bacterium]
MFKRVVWISVTFVVIGCVGCSGQKQSAGSQTTSEKKVAQEMAKPALLEVSVRPTSLPAGQHSQESGQGQLKTSGQPLVLLVAGCCHIRPTRIVADPKLPEDLYDVNIVTPNRPREVLDHVQRQALETAFGLTFRTEKREMSAYHLKVAAGGTRDGLRSNTSGSPESSSTGGANVGCLKATNHSAEGLSELLEYHVSLKPPVIDKTGLKGRYDFDLTVDSWGEADVNKALREQLGLELVPAREAVEVLVVDRTELGKK